MRQLFSGIKTLSKAEWLPLREKKKSKYSSYFSNWEYLRYHRRQVEQEESQSCWDKEETIEPDRICEQNIREEKKNDRSKEHWKFHRV